MPPSPETLLDAYRATSYCVRVRPGRRTPPVLIRLDRRSRGPALLRRLGVTSAVFITADNPRSQAQPRARNLLAERRLRSAVARARHRALPAFARPDDRHWPVEHGLLVLGMPRVQALKLAERFGQNAIVQLARHRPPALLATRWLWS